MKDEMKTLTMELPDPGDGLMWMKLHGDLPDCWDYFTDSNGAHWIRVRQYEAGGGCLIDLSECIHDGELS